MSVTLYVHYEVPLGWRHQSVSQLFSCIVQILLQIINLKILHFRIDLKIFWPWLLVLQLGFHIVVIKLVWNDFWDEKPQTCMISDILCCMIVFYPWNEFKQVRINKICNFTVNSRAETIMGFSIRGLYRVNNWVLSNISHL